MKSAYLVLDMQNDLTHTEGPNGESPLGQQVVARSILARTAQLIGKAREAGMLLVFVRVGFSADYRECPLRSQVFSGAPKAGIFKLGAWGTEIHPQLGFRADDALITKHRVSPFFGTNLDLILRNQGIERIYCSGVSTQAVVQATVRDGHDRDYDVVVVEDCCAAATDKEHHNSIGSISRFCQIEVAQNLF